MNKKTIITTDGSCSGNPGPGGYAAEIKRDNHIFYVVGNEPITTNNRMELMSIISALEMLYENETAIVITDSKYISEGCNKWRHKWKKNNWCNSEGKVKNVDLWMKLDYLLSTVDITIQWKNRNSIDSMVIVDKMAKEQTKKAKGS